MSAGEFLPPQRIGFVGLGNMGAPMARRVAAAGYPLVVADATSASLAAFAQGTDCERPATLTELARRCDVIVTMLPDSRVVETVLWGADGLSAGMAPGTVLIDMTSGSPLATREFAPRLAQQQVTLLDAPVSGGVPRAVAGTLAIMIGGDPQVIDRFGPLFAAMGKTFRTGIVGSGHAMKALNNFLSAIALVATAEAVIAGEKFGIDPKLMIDVFNASSGRNTATDGKFPAYVLTRSFDSGFALGLMAKDLGLAQDLARAGGGAMSLVDECTRLYKAAEQQFGFRADNTDIVRYLEAQSDSNDASAG